MDGGRRALLMVIATGPWTLSEAAHTGRKPVELRIASDGDELAFVPDRLTCIAGAEVRLRFHHGGKIISDPHDWVLLKPGTVEAFLADADKQEDWKVVIPRNDDSMVLAATPLCGKGKTVVARFTAPPPGNYPFVCSVAGHGETMRGILTVVVGH
jgi:azurin